MYLFIQFSVCSKAAARDKALLESWQVGDSEGLGGRQPRGGVSDEDASADFNPSEGVFWDQWLNA